MKYNITCDGEVIETIDLPIMLQRDRDRIRQDIANTYGVPVHYLKLSPVTRSYNGNAQENIRFS